MAQLRDSELVALCVASCQGATRAFVEEFGSGVRRRVRVQVYGPEFMLLELIMTGVDARERVESVMRHLEKGGAANTSS